MEIDVQELVDRSFGFYGVSDNCFKIGRKVYEVLENEDDGLRSSLDHVRVVDPDGRPFFRRALARVTLKVDHERDFEGWKLVGDNGHTWLRFGTDFDDTYYPYFVFEYTPKRA